jgi:phage-related protein
MIETGITFGEIHSFYDLNMVLSAKSIPPAKAKTSFIDVPGRDGSIDQTEVHGMVTYSDRELSFTFSMLPTDSSSWEEKQTEVSNLLNGLSCKITLDVDDAYYFQGRCTVDEYASDKKLRQIVVKARVNPYKYKQDITSLTFPLTGESQIVNLVNGKKAVVPTIECTNNTVIVFGSGTYRLSAGKHKVLDVCLKHGDNMLTVSGSGAVKFIYQEGDL